MPAHRGKGWPPEQVAELKRLYVEMGLEPRQIAVRMNLPLRRVTIRIHADGLGGLLSPQEKASRRRARLELALAARQERMRRAGFHWSADRVAVLRDLYLERHWAVGEIAHQMGATRDQVRSKVADLGLAKIRKAKGQRMAQSSKFLRLEAPVRVLRPGESNPASWRLTKDPKAALAKAARVRELNLTMAQLEAREVRRLEASAKTLALPAPEQARAA